MRSQYRCVAPDHIGFGLSSRSNLPADYHPKTHARNFTQLLEHLELDDISLFLTDWGGPIGLDFARLHPNRVKRIVLANTWCWLIDDDAYFVMFSRIMSSWPLQFLIKRPNFFVPQVMPRAVGDKKVLNPNVMALAVKRYLIPTLEKPVRHCQDTSLAPLIG